MSDVTPDSAETKSLLEQARAGRGPAFDRIFERHRQSLHKLIEFRLEPKLSLRIDASDVVQETHVEALRRLPDYLDRQPMPFRLWLRKIAIERLLNLRRKHMESARKSVRREVRLPDRSSIELARGLVASGVSPSTHVEKREQVRRVRRALDQFPSDDREVLLIRYVEGFSNKEAAYLLEISPDAPSKRHGRALLRIQKLLVDIS